MPTPKVIPIKKIESWSYTRYSDYSSCPAKAMYKHVLKMKEPGSAAMQRGTDIHKLAEDYAKGMLKKLPVELALFEDEFKALKGQKIKFIEESWVFKSDWSLTEWNDWNGAWLRIKMDAAYINPEYNALVIVDHKTGKYKPDDTAAYELQLELYGLAGLKKHPTVELVSPRLWYLDHGVIHPTESEIEYKRSDEKRLEKLWLGRVKKMMSDTTFKPTPGAACRYCHFRKDNNGPCKF